MNANASFKTSTAAHGAEVRISGVGKSYETRDDEDLLALAQLDLILAPGSFTAVVGPSGCGKSTLLSLVAGLLEPSTGEIRIDDDIVRKPHPKVGVVFQSDLLLYWRTILDNILLPIEVKRQNNASYVARAQALLSQVGLSDFANKYPDELSGGMRQRAAICRALIQEPGLLLMDEPFGALDALTREQMITDLQAMWARLGSTVLFITHGIEEAVFLADRVIVMSPRPGRVDADFPIDLPRPRMWNEVHGDPRFQSYVRNVRTIFEAKGVLVAR